MVIEFLSVCICSPEVYEINKTSKGTKNFSFIQFFLFFGCTEKPAGSQFPDQGWNPCLLPWKHGVLTLDCLGSPSLNFYLAENPNIPLKKNYLFIWLRGFFFFFFNYLFLVVLGLPCCLWGFLQLQGSPLQLRCAHFSLQWLLLLATSGSRVPTLQNVWLPSSRARQLWHMGFQLLHGLWDLPGPGIKPVSPALAGGFFFRELRGKPHTGSQLRPVGSSSLTRNPTQAACMGSGEFQPLDQPESPSNISLLLVCRVSLDRLAYLHVVVQTIHVEKGWMAAAVRLRLCGALCRAASHALKDPSTAA